jgi:RimJ/RimL family protein N-acetyltransferase
LDYPADGDVVSSRAYLSLCTDRGDPQPFGAYQIIDISSGMVVGGAGFHGPPKYGAVEIGYGVVPSARRKGFATEAARQLVDIARINGVRNVIARTEPNNLGSLRVLKNVGMRRVSASADLHTFHLALSRA